MYYQKTGFSKLSKQEKLSFLVENYLDKSPYRKKLIESFWHSDEKTQQSFDEFSENTITNFYLPYGIVPDVCINGESYCVPMVTEESSVVAAAARANKFWLARGGIHTKVMGTQKIGKIHFFWKGESQELFEHFSTSKDILLKEVSSLVENMERRGGGIEEMKLSDRTEDEPYYYQIWMTFQTCDAMGANFINSVLEAIGKSFQQYLQKMGKNIEIIMAILSNYTPNCLVRAQVSTPVEEMYDSRYGLEGRLFAEKFSHAVRIADLDPYRGVTHNKGIMNGVDAVVLATGNDFRATEACAHAYASRTGTYRSLTKCTIDQGVFSFALDLPIALGSVGGLTSLHPMAKISLDMLKHPSASRLMEIAGAIGLLQNFAALSSLVTTGIQKGHMKMHLVNILNHLEANDWERERCKERFKTEAISFNNVKKYIEVLRKQ